MKKHIANCKRCADNIKTKYLSEGPINKSSECCENVNEEDADVLEVDDETAQAGTSEHPTATTSCEKETPTTSSSTPVGEKSSRPLHSFFNRASANSPAEKSESINISTSSKARTEKQPKPRSSSATGIRGSLFTPQKNKIEPYMDHMTDVQIVSIYIIFLCKIIAT